MDWCYKTLNQTIFAIYLEFSLRTWNICGVIRNSSYLAKSILIAAAVWLRHDMEMFLA